MFQTSMMTDADVERILDGVFTTLERVGMMFQNPKLLQALQKAGANVDYAQERARIPRRIIQDVIDHVQRQTPADGRQVPETPKPPGLPTLGCQVAQFYLDWAGKERRRGNRADLIRMLHLGDVLHEGGSVGHCLLMTDVPATVEPLEAAALLVEHTHHPGQTYPHYAEQFDYLMEMGEIYAGRKDRFLTGWIFITSPLRVCRRAADFMVRRVEMGNSFWCGTMACVGASVPVTLGGAIVVTAAELLGTWAAGYAMNPRASFGGSVACGSIDLRAGNATYCSPEAMLLNLGTIEFFRRVCGIRMGVAGASDYTDAKFPGLAAAWEKAAKVMTIAAYTGVLRPVGEGMLESGKTLSPEQLIIERDLTRQLHALAKPIDFGSEGLALETIEEIGCGLTQNYMSSEHTLRNFRSSIWHPTVFDRGTWRSFEFNEASERQVVDRAHEVVEEKLRQYVPPEVDGDKMRAMRAVIERARQRISFRQV